MDHQVSYHQDRQDQEFELQEIAHNSSLTWMSLRTRE